MSKRISLDLLLIVHQKHSLLPTVMYGFSTGKNFANCSICMGI
ncbi:hypothetical protein RV10_GL001777 [Enterococcus pallens]|nr:hypothetical protein RV10_GL001777 [Enterococcus pallens]